MNRVLTVLLITALSASAYLLWWQQSRIPPDDSQLASDLLAIKARRQDTTRPSTADAIDAQTEALLLQKQRALLRFVDLKYVVDGAPVAAASTSELEALDKDIGETERKLAEARAEAAKYTGGGILAFIAMRTAMEETTLTALHQTRLMRKYGLAIPKAAEAQPGPPDVDRLAALDSEIAAKRAAISMAEEEAARYGGLLQVTALIRAATEKVTVAMLEQQRIAVKYGIAYPQGPQTPKAVHPGRVVNDKEALQ